MKKTGTIIFFIVAILIANASAQTTEFTYQGSLKDGAVVANGNYDFEFRLYDAVSGGSLVSAVATRTNVAVANGIFAVTLDFGMIFPGADRFLDIRVRNAGGGGYTTLNPRQKVGSSPYAIKSLSAETAVSASTAINATQLGGVAANQYVLTGDARLSDPRPPTAGSANYIQNTNSVQGSSNFNISGNGTAGGTLSGNIVDATTQYNIGANRILSNAGSDNFFAGVGAGTANTSGSSNTFAGGNAGNANTTGVGNSFFGVTAGRDTTNGSANSFFGRQAGQSNTSGGSNSFFGRVAGISNTTGSNNTAIGALSGVDSGNLSFATAIGAGAVVTASNTIALGRADGSDVVRIPGRLALLDLGTGGSTPLCRNGLITGPQISTCSSSLRYKTNINGFGLGLDLVKLLKPITFDWKEGGMHDLGLGAEDVAVIEPLLVTYNSKGEVEGVKYDRIGVVLINAIREQQAQIETLKEIVCELKLSAAICKEKEK